MLSEKYEKTLTVILHSIRGLKKSFVAVKTLYKGLFSMDFI